jgi:Tfp pilus assembly protein FimT
MRQTVKPASMRSSAGITVVELVVVIAIMAILVALGLPSFIQWRQNLAYRDAARNIISELRQAKSQAIATNIKQCVRFDAAGKQYGFSSDCAAVSNWTSLDSQVTITPSTDIEFTPTGVASSGTGTVFILDSSGNQRFYVQVEQTGRTSIGSH